MIKEVYKNTNMCKKRKTKQSLIGFSKGLGKDRISIQCNTMQSFKVMIRSTFIVI